VLVVPVPATTLFAALLFKVKLVSLGVAQELSPLRNVFVPGDPVALNWAKPTLDGGGVTVCTAFPVKTTYKVSFEVVATLNVNVFADAV